MILRGEKWMWYAVQTEPGQEELVKCQVRSKLLDGTLHSCKVLYYACKKRYLGTWHDKMELFLPGYLFLVMEGSEHGLKSVNEILETDSNLQDGGVFSKKEIVPIERDEEEFLVKITGGKDEIGMSYGIIRDGVLEIFKGVLTGMESRVRKIDRHKRKCQIGIWIANKESIADIGLEIIEKIYSMQNLP